MTEAGEFAGGQGIEALHGGDVGAGDKGLLPRAGKDHHLDGRVALDAGEAALQFLEGRFVEGVEGLGTIDGDNGDALACFKQQVAEFHVVDSLAHDQAYS